MADFIKSLSATKQRFNKKKIFGFDIETYDKNKKFLCCSLYHPKETLFFTKRPEDVFSDRSMKNSLIAATNLSFDFFGTFFGEKAEKDFRLVWRGSDLLSAKTYIKDGKLSSRYEKNSDSLTFIDTGNYGKLSVEQMGKIIKIPKMKKPDFLGNYPKDKKEWDEIKEYNINDSRISMEFLTYLYKGFEDIGATAKTTIAQTALSCFKNRYLKERYFVHDEKTLLDEFNAYYGGNTHAYDRGYFRNYDYYDINSLYPAMMLNEYPNPNNYRTTTSGKDDFIMGWEGVSDVSIEVPYAEFPLLPMRTKDKLIMPYGTFRGWYSHLELREATDRGANIIKIHKTIYYKDTCSPFADYINELYQLRMEYKKEGSRMEYIVKLLLNSLGGKFGQKFTDKEELLHIGTFTKEEICELPYIYERVGEYLRIIKPYNEPSSFCFPIWSLYMTAYGRLKLHEYIRRARPIYIDTDSFVTRKSFITSDKLGGLKHEMHIDEGVIIRPKMYMFNGKAKIKGINLKSIINLRTTAEFKMFLTQENIYFEKFTRVREALRRKLIPNEIINAHKHFNLEDDKREWSKTFSFDELQGSQPLMVIDNQIIKSNLLKEKFKYRFNSPLAYEP